MIALDLFAGTGWGVACRALGIEEHGVEIMPEAVATRAANGMTTFYNDVWDGLEAGGPRLPEYDLLIASPPCQTFSLAGSGSGRQALDEVLQAIDDRLFAIPSALREFGEKHDPRTALVLTPLAHVFRDAPTYVVLEQVPPVLPVWERYAEVMRRWGYSVWTGNLQAEQYGVPQTRKRAILIARADGIEAAPPAPTHSRYYSRDPQRLDEGVLPWVSMAEALGWGMTARPMVTAGNAIGRAEGIGGSGGKAAINREKAGGRWSVRTSMGTPKVDGRNGSHELDPELRPMHTVTGKVGEARVMRSNYGTGGDPAARGERAGDEPSATVTSKADRNKWEGEGASVESTRVTVAEAAALQSYPEGFEWAGTKTKQFLQIGNAVPPLLAEAILREVLRR